jgi:hypothetical protein
LKRSSEALRRASVLASFWQIFSFAAGYTLRQFSGSSVTFLTRFGANSGPEGLTLAPIPWCLVHCTPRKLLTYCEVKRRELVHLAFLLKLPRDPDLNRTSTRMIFRHPVTGVIALTVIFQVWSSNAFSVRDSDGVWRRSLSWEKRSNPGDVLRIPLTNNKDKSYSVRHSRDVQMFQDSIQRRPLQLAVRMGTPFQEVEMAVSLSQNHIAVATPETPGQAGLFVRCSHLFPVY